MVMSPARIDRHALETSDAAGVVAPGEGDPEDVDPAQVLARANLLWPGLDQRRLGRTGGDPGRVTRLVSRRSALPPESIRAMLVGAD
jgi:hypothetical protein